MLIGHSLGAAIPTCVAAKPAAVPLIGLAISGVGMRTPSELPLDFLLTAANATTAPRPVGCLVTGSSALLADRAFIDLQRGWFHKGHLVSYKCLLVTRRSHP